MFVTYQWLVGTLQVIAGLGIVLLIVELSFKTAKRDSWFTKRYFPILNVVLASEWWFLCRSCTLVKQATRAAATHRV